MKLGDTIAKLADIIATHTGRLVVEDNARGIAQHCVLLFVEQWARVDLQEPRLQVLVHNEIASKELETAFGLVTRQMVFGFPKQDSQLVRHFGEELLIQWPGSCKSSILIRSTHEP